MTTFDFSNCKSVEDVEKVFGKKKDEIKTLKIVKKEFKNLRN